MDKKIIDLFRRINYGVEDRFDGNNYRYYHCLRTAKLALEISESDSTARAADHEAVLLLALFHDIGKSEKLVAENNLDPKEHDANNIPLFEKYIYPLLGGEEFISRLREIVQDFSHEKYEFSESRLVRDADNLDEIGILNLWRMGTYAGKHHADVEQSTSYYFNIDRQMKIDKMNGLFFDYSRKIFEERLLEMDSLEERLKEIAVVDIEELEF